VHPDSLLHLQALLTRVFHSEAIAGVEAVLVSKEGREIAVEGNLSPRVSGGEIIACQGIFRDITQRQQAEAHLRDYAQRVGILSRQLLDAQETERSSLARELHDDLGQLLTALNFNLATILKGRTCDLRKARVRSCQELVGRALEYVRNLSLALRPPMLDDYGLIPALRWYLTQQAEHAPFTLDLDVDGPQTRLPTEIETACYRVVQEAITNIARHAKAHHVKVLLQQSEQKLDLSISDDGCGFDVPAAFRRCQAGASMGLANMRERIEMLGGRFVIESCPGTGTTVRVELSVASSHSLQSGR